MRIAFFTLASTILIGCSGERGPRIVSEEVELPFPYGRYEVNDGEQVRGVVRCFRTGYHIFLISSGSEVSGDELCEYVNTNRDAGNRPVTTFIDIDAPERKNIIIGEINGVEPMRLIIESNGEILDDNFLQYLPENEQHKPY